MHLPDLARTGAFRWTLAIAAWFATLSLLLFVFVYWQTAVREREQSDILVLHESGYIAGAPRGAVTARLETWLQEDRHNVRYAALFGLDGNRLAGNMPTLPAGLPMDGAVHEMNTHPLDDDGVSRCETVRAVARRLNDGVLVIGYDTDEIKQTRAVILRALGLGVPPMLLLSLAAGALLGHRARLRVAAVDHAIGRVMAGHLGERLPVRGRGDELDRLAGSVNAMLAEIERLVGEICGVGDSIAHDLRTPLTRTRARLERSRNLAHTQAEFHETLDRAVAWIDQTLAIITAVLRIGEIEHGRRRAAFAPVDLAPLVREVAELYDPIAEEKGVCLVVDAPDPVPATLGDRDLIFEAVANLVDNAVKFTPGSGEVRLALSVRPDGIVIRVEDSGPGIPPADREKVLQRFYRAERSRHEEGSGLGLSLVSAVAGLHGFGLTIGGDCGCVVELICPRTELSLIEPSRTAATS